MRVVGHVLLAVLAYLMVLGGVSAMVVGFVAVGSYIPFSASEDPPGWFVPVFLFGGLALTVCGVRLIRRSRTGGRGSARLRRLNL